MPPVPAMPLFPGLGYWLVRSQVVALLGLVTRSPPSVSSTGTNTARHRLLSIGRAVPLVKGAMTGVRRQRLWDGKRVYGSGPFAVPPLGEGEADLGPCHTALATLRVLRPRRAGWGWYGREVKVGECCTAV